MTLFNDDKLREQFDELRGSDQATMPSFRAQWDRAAAVAANAPQRRLLQRTPLLIAAAAVVVIAASVVVRRHADAARAGLAAPSITSWTSPTASLLRTPGAEWLASPSILSSSIDGALGAPVNHKGVSR
jgi:hypothetical protein